MVPVLGGFALTQFRRLSAYYGFTVSETPAGLQIRRGLFERDATTITLARVQGVVIGEPVLWRRFGWVRATMRVAGVVAEGNQDPRGGSLVPVGTVPTAERVGGAIP